MWSFLFEFWRVCPWRSLQDVSELRWNDRCHSGMPRTCAGNFRICVKWSRTFISVWITHRAAWLLSGRQRWSAMWRLGRESLGNHSKDPTSQMIRSVCVRAYLYVCEHACALTWKVYLIKTLQSECIGNVSTVKITLESCIQPRWRANEFSHRRLFIFGLELPAVCYVMPPVTVCACLWEWVLHLSMPQTGMSHSRVSQWKLFVCHSTFQKLVIRSSKHDKLTLWRLLYHISNAKAIASKF